MTRAIYLAARYSRREELCTYRDLLEHVGYKITSRWLLGEHQISDTGLNALGKTTETLPDLDHYDRMHGLCAHGASRGTCTVHVAVATESTEADAVALRTRFAQEDWTDLTKADIVLSFTEPPRASASRGGRHVEFGAALALNKRCLVVGPRENVFHCLPQVEVYDAWIPAFAELARSLAAHYRDATRAMAVSS